MTRKFSDLHPNEQDRSLVVELTPSTFGGGWVVAMNDPSSEYLSEYFEDEAIPLAPLGGDYGFVVEPCDLDDLVAALKADGAIVL